MTSLRWLPLSHSPARSTLGGLALAAFAAVPAMVSAATYSTADEVARRSFKTATAFAEVLVAPGPKRPSRWPRPAARRTARCARSRRARATSCWAA